MNAAFVRAALLLAPFLAGCGGDGDSLTGGPGPAGGASDTNLPAREAPGAADADAAGLPPTSAPAADSGAGGDAGGDTGAPSGPNAFTGAGAFVSKLGVSARVSSHNFPGNNPTNSPSGQACKTCHPGFFMGGTIFADAAGTKPAAGVEVRARDAAGNAVSAWTDQDGNFYQRTIVGLPALVGVRDATTTKPMVGTIANGTCASSACHVAGKEGPVHLP